VVTTLEAEADAGYLSDSSLFFFTDNSTVEAVIHKGNSKSKKLFWLLVRFKKAILKRGLHVTVSHISRRRMIAQGTDGVSRGCLSDGVAAGMSMMDFIPLHLNAFQQNPG
jgi:hypothetical protein